MKTKKQIETNLNQKIAIYQNALLESESEARIIQHIRMLDWVLSDGSIKEFRDILKERGIK